MSLSAALTSRDTAKRLSLTGMAVTPMVVRESRRTKEPRALSKLSRVTADRGTTVPMLVKSPRLRRNSRLSSSLCPYSICTRTSRSPSCMSGRRWPPRPHETMPRRPSGSTPSSDDRSRSTMRCTSSRPRSRSVRTLSNSGRVPSPSVNCSSSRRSRSSSLRPARTSESGPVRSMRISLPPCCSRPTVALTPGSWGAFSRSRSGRASRSTSVASSAG